MSEFYTPLVLKLYAHGLHRLTDPDWTGLDLFYLLKKPVRRDKMLLKTQHEGLLYHLGLWFYEEYVLEEGDGSSGPFLKLSGDHLAWYLEDMLDMLQFHGISGEHSLISESRSLLETLNNEFDLPLEKVTLNLDSKKGKRKVKHLISALRSKFYELFKELAPQYAKDYAHRVFHDRELCGYVSELIICIGYPGEDDVTGEPQKWVERCSFPEWAKRAVIARDRGMCAECGNALVMELMATPNIDHIIPLAAGGSNDIVNLQLLCQQCNLKKSKSKKPVRSSIPKYMQKKSK